MSWRAGPGASTLLRFRGHADLARAGPDKPYRHGHGTVIGRRCAIRAHYSQFLALLLEARYERIPTPVYQLAAVYHTG